MIGTKMMTMKMKVTLFDNITSGGYFNESGQSISNIKINNSTTVSTDFSSLNTSGYYTLYDTIPSSLLTNSATCTYTLSGISYSLRTDGWYIDKACTIAATNQLIHATWNNSDNLILYAKWVTKSAGSRTVTSSGDTTVQLPKFVNYISGSCIGGGAASGYPSSNLEEDADDDQGIALGFWSCGRNGGSASFSSTAIKNHSTVTLHVGAASSGNGNDSYIKYTKSNNTSGQTTASGATKQGKGNSGEFNLYPYDSDNKKYTGEGGGSIAAYLTSNSATNYYTVDVAKTRFVKLSNTSQSYSSQLDDDDNGVAKFWKSWFGSSYIRCLTTNRRRSGNRLDYLYPVGFEYTNTYLGKTWTYGVGAVNYITSTHTHYSDNNGDSTTTTYSMTNCGCVVRTSGFTGIAYNASNPSGNGEVSCTAVDPKNKGSGRVIIVRFGPYGPGNGGRGGFVITVSGNDYQVTPSWSSSNIKENGHAGSATINAWT